MIKNKEASMIGVSIILIIFLINISKYRTNKKIIEITNEFKNIKTDLEIINELYCKIDSLEIELENSFIEIKPIYPGRRHKVSDNKSENSKTKFMRYIIRAAKAESKIYTDIPYQIYVAQAILESNYGKSIISRKGNNLYGHKHKSKKGKYLKAYDDKKDDKFTIFNSRWESIRSHSKKLMGMYRQRIDGIPTLEKWIESLCGGNTIEESLNFIEKGNSVYATNCYKLSSDDDICYGNKIMSIIKKHNLI